MHDVRQFFPLDSVQEVAEALNLNGHEIRTWSGGKDIGLQPCPCPTHLEARTEDGRPIWLVWHGCAALDLVAEDFDRGDYCDRDPRLLSAICNWLVELHQEQP